MKVKLRLLRLPNHLDSMTSLTMFQKTFKAILKDLWEEHAPPDHNANITVDGPRVTVFTDGSGISGRAVDVLQQDGDGVTGTRKNG